MEILNVNIFPAFWAVSVAIAFVFGYVLMLCDRSHQVRQQEISKAKILSVGIVGTLAVVGIYTSVLSAKPFEWTDCFTYALIFCQGWTADALVQRVSGIAHGTSLP